MDGRAAAAREQLYEVIALAEAAGMEVIAALARRRAGALTPGAAGARQIAEADAVLHRHGVANPTRFARAFATWPGEA